jgi:hypothetical protein
MFLISTPPHDDFRDLCASFPRCRSFPPRSHAVHQKRCAVEPQIPLCDLRDLCAMLSRCGSFPPKSHAVHQKRCASNLNPPCDLRAMLSPIRVFPALKPIYPPKSVARSNPKSPSVTSVTSVRCFPGAGLSRPEANPSTKKPLRGRTSNPPSVTSVTSVRCFPRCGSFPPRSRAVHQKAFVEPQFPPQIRNIQNLVPCSFM